MPKQQKIRKKNQQKISQNWPKLAISVTKRLIEDMEPSLLQLANNVKIRGSSAQFQFQTVEIEIDNFSFDDFQF